MKSLRKSLNGNKEPTRQQISTPLPSLPRASHGVVPPQKVIRATETHRANAIQELSFEKGDFFYVLRDGDVNGIWYEAHNPVTGARGFVPRAMFEEINKSPTPVRTSQTPSAPSISRPGSSMSTPMTSPVQATKHKSFYAVVLHDFQAERADELDAKAGESIFVVAQSNREWFVAKPIGKLGRPGLIPVAFVEIRDPTTSKPVVNVMELIETGDLPTVEEWKKQVHNYKQNSIPLGTLEEFGNSTVADSPFQRPAVNGDPSSKAGPSVPNKAARAPTPQPTSVQLPLPQGILLTADVVSFHEEMEEFWFRVDAVYQPYVPGSNQALQEARQLVLFRVYNDFYDFQVKLLNTFPREAGRVGNAKRVLPYMPGPTDVVDTDVTATRRIELSDYLHKLCELSFAGARHILEHEVVRDFLSAKPGDVETGIEPRYDQIDAIYGDEIAEQLGMLRRASSPAHHDRNNGEIADHIGKMSLGGGNATRYSDGSEYESDLRQRAAQTLDTESSLALRQQAHVQNHQRSHSAMGSHAADPGRTTSPPPSNRYPDHYAQPYHAPSTTAPSTMSRTSSSGRDDRSSGGYPSSAVTTPTTASTTRTRSHSNANNFNAPPISSSNPNTSFIKIKIFDRVTDDLIAIRVHPQITHAELMNKVQARLGGEVKCLRFRDPQSKEIQNLADDNDLAEWLADTDKPVLYAD